MCVVTWHWKEEEGGRGRALMWAKKNFAKCSDFAQTVCTHLRISMGFPCVVLAGLLNILYRKIKLFVPCYVRRGNKHILSEKLKKQNFPFRFAPSSSFKRRWKKSGQRDSSLFLEAKHHLAFSSLFLLLLLASDNHLVDFPPLPSLWRQLFLFL